MRRLCRAQRWAHASAHSRLLQGPRVRARRCPARRSELPAVWRCRGCPRLDLSPRESASRAGRVGLRADVGAARRVGAAARGTYGHRAVQRISGRIDRIGALLRHAVRQHAAVARRAAARHHARRRRPLRLVRQVLLVHRLCERPRGRALGARPLRRAGLSASQRVCTTRRRRGRGGGDGDTRAPPGHRGEGALAAAAARVLGDGARL
mmetsp:Transcript_7785/g.17189  ORF Transcript_7785/g.17189 Transcript_7785/m.17189 type:complete len:208 (+) Transcript_7785:705-1328(+)